MHNILHGIYFFGSGSWAKISNMYKFLPGHCNLSIRVRVRVLRRLNLLSMENVNVILFPCFPSVYFLYFKVIPDNVLIRLQPRFTGLGKKYFKNMIVNNKSKIGAN